MRKVIDGGQIVNEGRSFVGAVVIADDRIEEIIEGKYVPRGSCEDIVDATGCFVLPGVIDEHVHFREPGLTRKGDIESETRAAASGGVTSFLEMPNTIPQTTTLEAHAEKMAIAARSSKVNYGFFFGATKDNHDQIGLLDKTRVPGVKLFMGASTGNMLVSRRDSLQQIFKVCADEDLPLMTHCEDSIIINNNLAKIIAQHGADPDVSLHPAIRSEEACYQSSALAVELAEEFGTRLHVAHLSTAKELSLFQASDGKSMPRITAEAVIPHLWFDDSDYLTKGTHIKCNPAVKTRDDREALRRALTDGRIAAVGTDHAPHELKDKQGGCCNASSGMPMLQFSLVAMLALVDEGVLPIERVVALMAHHPAQIFSISERGYLRKGYKADLVIVEKGSPWTVTEDIIQSKCGWSPMTGETFRWRVRQTYCNGNKVYDNGMVNEDYRGEALRFRL